MYGMSIGFLFIHQSIDLSHFGIFFCSPNSPPQLDEWEQVKCQRQWDFHAKEKTRCLSKAQWLEEQGNQAPKERQLAASWRRD